jgi:predicted amidohydrolase
MPRATPVSQTRGIMRSVTLAAVQPLAFRGEEEYKNVERALAYIDEAAAGGAQIIAFPEGYPGPYYGQLTYDPDEQIRERARARGIYVVYSRLEAAPADPDYYYCILRLIDRNGDVLGSYRRLQTTPTHVNDVLFGKDLVPGPEEDLVVYETEIGNLGLLICSEVYSPELARVLTLKGADILFYPIGGLIYELTDTWKTMIWARAIENLVYVAATQNLYGCEEGIGTIAGPEQIVAQSKRPGMLLATLDLERLQELRDLDQRLDLPMPYRVIPGLLRWRRPELYGELSRATSGVAT